MNSFNSIDNLQQGKTGRISSWDPTGGNADFVKIPPKSTYLMADINGIGKITHLWFTGWFDYRDMILKITWDDAKSPSILVPYGDFFGQGNCFVNSYQCMYFSSSTDSNNQQNQLSALNCYLPMPFKKRAKIEVINDSENEFIHYFYIDYELFDNPSSLGPDPAYLHAEFRLHRPFGGWGPEIKPNTPEIDIIKNIGENAWNNNYILMEVKGRGHYLGCFFNVVNLQAKSFKGYDDPKYSWWGEGDDIIWVDGYKWPPDIHGTGSEDYFNQALGMQRNAFLRNGTSIHEFDTGGYSTSYIFHIENPIRFQKEIKATIEIGHANHLGNDISSVAFFYLDKPIGVLELPNVEKRRPIKKINGKWIISHKSRTSNFSVPITPEIQKEKDQWARIQISKIYKQSVGLLRENTQGKLIMETYFSGNKIEVFFNEVLEDLVDEAFKSSLNPTIRFQIFDTVKILKISENLDILENEIEPIIRPFLNKKLKLISGSLLEKEKIKDEKIELCVVIHDRISFRD